MGMSQPVVLKSNRYGINLIMDADMPFGQLEEAILEKFRESESFLKTRRSQFLLRDAGSHRKKNSPYWI